MLYLESVVSSLSRCNKILEVVRDMQISVDFDPDLYQQIEASVKSARKSISDFIIDKVQIGLDEESALKKLEDFIEHRLDAADRGAVSEKSIDEIISDAFENALKN